MFAGEAGEGEEETIGGYFYCYFYWCFYRSGWKVFRFLALGFNSQNTHARMRIRNRHTYYISSFLRHESQKKVPIPRRASSFLVVFFCIHVNRKEGETKQQQTYQFTKGCNIVHRLQVHRLTLTFIIHNKYISTLYLYTYRIRSIRRRTSNSSRSRIVASLRDQ